MNDKYAFYTKGVLSYGDQKVLGKKIFNYMRFDCNFSAFILSNKNS